MRTAIFTSRLPLAGAVLLGSFGAAADARAQDERELVTVLSFEGGSEAAELYDMTRAQVEFHPRTLLNDIPPQSLQELKDALGCIDFDAECATIAAETLGSDLLYWGSIETTATGYSLSMTLYDLVEPGVRMERTFAIDGDLAALEAFAPVAIRAILYGDVATATITTSPEDASVYVDDVFAGISPVTVEGQPIGRHELRFESEGFESRTESVIFDIGENEFAVVLGAVEVAEVVPVREPREPREQREPREPREGGRFDTRIVGYALWGTGAGLLAGGIASGIATQNTQDEFDAELEQAVLDRNRAESLRDEGQSQALVTNVLLTSGALALVGGTVVFVLADPAEEDGRGARNDRGLRGTVAVASRRVTLGIQF